MIELILLYKFGLNEDRHECEKRQKETCAKDLHILYQNHLDEFFLASRERPCNCDSLCLDCLKSIPADLKAVVFYS